VTRTWIEVCLRIVFGSLVFVPDEEANGSAESDAMLNTGLDLYEILFVPLCSAIDQNKDQET
jgi:hypothetical protein